MQDTSNLEWAGAPRKDLSRVLSSVLFKLWINKLINGKTNKGNRDLESS